MLTSGSLGTVTGEKPCCDSERRDCFSHEKIMLSTRKASNADRRVQDGVIVPAFMLDRGCLTDHQECWHSGVLSIRAASTNRSPSIEGSEERIGIYCVITNQLCQYFNRWCGVGIPLLKIK